MEKIIDAHAQALIKKLKDNSYAYYLQLPRPVRKAITETLARFPTPAERHGKCIEVSRYLYNSIDIPSKPIPVPCLVVCNLNYYYVNCFHHFVLYGEYLIDLTAQQFSPVLPLIYIRKLTQGSSLFMSEHLRYLTSINGIPYYDGLTQTWPEVTSRLDRDNFTLLFILNTRE